MASYNPAAPPTSHRPTLGVPIPMADPAAPPGTFAPGTKIQVGNVKVVIQKYFSEGGFAHVYLVKMPKAIDGSDIAVLKRVAVPDKEHLANMRTEVETMKKLKGHRAIVTYYDSHASQLKGGGYEVFLLMEFCSGGGLIDFMNTRLQNRLTEPEILKIFSDVAEGVACMHYLKPPLLHRDLKVENVLISATGGARRFKLCDFGSTAPPRPAASTAAECRLIEDDVQKHTTLQYRSPEMIDVYRKQAIDEKSDIWALGVLLYKLCYYTTPFEAQGQLAILNASFKFPAYPPFSDPLKKLIASTLKENPKSRPNIYQVLREACLMQRIEVPIKDIYTGRTQSEARRNQQLPSPELNITSPPTVGAVFAPPQPQKQVIPDVVPMRRGRPVVNAQPHVNKPSPSPLRNAGDPFAALDSKSPPAVVDEISARFPSLDQFSLLHDGGKFDFGATSPTKPTAPKELNQRVAERLADDAFAVPVQRQVQQPPVSAAKPPNSTVSKAQQIIANNPDLQSPPPSVVYQPSPTRIINNSYVSQGTMTSQTPPPVGQPSRYAPSPVQRLSSSNHHRSASLPRTEDSTPNRSPWLRPQNYEQQTTLPPRQAPATLQPGGHTRNSSSSRPSLEGGRPSQEVIDMSRARSANARPRPSSTYLESNMDFLREQESAGRPSMSEKRNSSYSKESAIVLDEPEDTNIASNVDFLKTMEESDATKKDRRKSSGSGHKSKRTSLPSMSLAGTKNLLAGRFGDAFKRFEQNAPPAPRTPSPLHDLERRDLTPIAGSEATDGRSDDGRYDDQDAADLPPEQRRELERRRLSMEERRVANAAAEYRQRVANRDPHAAPPPRSIGGVSRATSIQNKVKSLLDESGTTSPTSPVRRTAEGYGRYTDEPTQANAFRSQLPSSSLATSSTQPPLPNPSANYSKPSSVPLQSGALGRKPMVPTPGIAHARTLPNQSQGQSEIDYSKPRVPQGHQPQGQPPNQPHIPVSASSPALSSSAFSSQNRAGGPPSGRPSAPPKPTHLNSASTGSSLTKVQSLPQSQSIPLRSTQLPPNGSVRDALPSTKDPLNNQPITYNKPNPRSSTSSASGPGSAAGRIPPASRDVDPNDMTPQEKEDYIADFSKRFPSLSGIELVEREIESGSGNGNGNGNGGGSAFASTFGRDAAAGSGSAGTGNGNGNGNGNRGAGIIERNGLRGKEI